MKRRSLEQKFRQLWGALAEVEYEESNLDPSSLVNKKIQLAIELKICKDRNTISACPACTEAEKRFNKMGTFEHPCLLCPLMWDTRKEAHACEYNNALYKKWRRADTQEKARAFALEIAQMEWK